MRKLVQMAKVTTIVETGTKRAATAVKLVSLVPNFYTIELNEKLSSDIERRLRSYPQANVIYGDSAKSLEALLPDLNAPVLFYLDAHSGDEIGTLRDELAVISKFPILMESSILVIHDICVPNMPFGHNNYSYIDIKPLLDEINPEHGYCYNYKAGGLKRGVLFVGPKKVINMIERVEVKS